MTPSTDFYRTNDMALATFLKLRQHAVQGMEWEAGTCFWIFRATESCLSDVNDFTSDKALVNPREYNRVFTQTKKEFYNSQRESAHS